MNTYSTLYKDISELQSFVNSINITSKHKVLVQVFTSIFNKDIIKDLINTIKSILPNAKIIGATSNSIIYNSSCVENQTLISITTFENTKLKTYALKYKGGSSYELGKSFFNNISRKNSKAIIVFASPLKIDPQELLVGISYLNRDIHIAGGIADSNSKHKDFTHNTNCISYVFNEDKIFEDGVVGACLYGENLFVNSVSNCSWLPIGKEHIVTEAKDNYVISIDNTPAVEFYSNYLGKENLDLIYTIENQFPLMVNIHDEYLSIPIKNIKDNYIETSTKIPIGSKIKLGYGNINHILESTKDKMFETSSLPVETIFVYSCVGRQLFLNNLVDYELKPLSKALNINGFFARGEFLYKNSHSNFVSHTATVLCLSENKDSRVCIDETKYDIDPEIYNIQYKFLYNIIKTTTDELDDLNLNLEKIIDEKTKELKIQYYTDNLTKLPNRVKFLNDLQNTEGCYLAIIDINNFSEVNDFYGNKIGDLLLISFTEKLLEFCHSSNLSVYRINSDVFGIIDDSTLNHNDFLNIIGILYKIITETAFECSNTSIYITVNIGIASGNTSVLEKAEMALDHAKHSANNIKLYTENIPLKTTYENNIKWVTELREAIKEDRIKPFFQGIYNNATGEIEKYESLMRLIRKDGSIVAPIHFLKISKKSGIYTELTKIMINKAFEIFEDSPYDFSINLSVEDIRDSKTRELIYNKLENSSIAKHAIFEIVESENISDYADIKVFISKIHEYGAKIAIDDFGTGYSNFEYIINLNIDYLKIDGSIIKNINSDKSSELIAETISNFSSKLGIPTIAEFVHNKEVHQKVNQMGLCYSQGYYFSEPNSELMKKPK